MAPAPDATGLLARNGLGRVRDTEDILGGVGHEPLCKLALELFEATGSNPHNPYFGHDLTVPPDPDGLQCIPLPQPDVDTTFTTSGVAAECSLHPLECLVRLLPIPPVIGAGGFGTERSSASIAS